MKKIFLIALMVICFSFNAHALTLVWNPYLDTTATFLRIESSTDGINYIIAVDTIPTAMVATAIPNGPDQTRVYYRMRAYNDIDQSTTSNVVSFYWTTGGGGWEGLSPVDNIHLLDCDAILTDPNHADYALCTGQWNPAAGGG